MTTTAGRAQTNRCVLHPRLCAVAVAGSIAVHMWLAVTGGHDAWLGALMLALAAVCVPCVVHIWRHSRVAALRRVMACALCMVAVHGLLLAGRGAGGHAHGAVPQPHAAGVNGAGGLLLVIAVEITTALLAATLLARLRRVSPSV